MSFFFAVANLWQEIIFAAITSLAGAMFTGYFEGRRFSTLHDTRAIGGVWKGRLKYTDEPFTLHFHEKQWWHPSYWVNPRILTGTILFEGDEPIACRGGFYSSNHLTLDYKSTHKRISQFGTMLVEVASSGDTMNGQYIGFYDEVFAEKIELNRVKPKKS